MNPKAPGQQIPAEYEILSHTERPKNRPDKKTIFRHTALFAATLLSVTLVGAGFVGFDPVLFPFGLPNLSDFFRGLLFAGLLLAFLTAHEFGHYFAAVYHNVRVTLPYYIPIPLGIGTLGAVIRIKEQINRTYKLFDIGVAGPIAGFIVSFLVLLIGFATLPEPDYLANFAGHDDLAAYIAEHGQFPESAMGGEDTQALTVGHTLLYSFMASFFDNVPPMWEMYHYPFLFAGWLGLFFTALNLMPVGQLDGGHILYSLLGREKHNIAARLFYTLITILAGVEVVPFLQNLLAAYTTLSFTAWFIWSFLLYALIYRAFNGNLRWTRYMLFLSVACTAAYLSIMDGAITREASFIWLVWSFFIAFIVKVEHPPVMIEEELSTRRKVIGWISMLIFVLCISPNPLYLN